MNNSPTLHIGKTRNFGRICYTEALGRRELLREEELMGDWPDEENFKESSALCDLSPVPLSTVRLSPLPQAAAALDFVLWCLELVSDFEIRASHQCPATPALQSVDSSPAIQSGCPG